MTGISAGARARGDHNSRSPPEDVNTRILHSGSKAPDRGYSRNHGA